MQNSERIAHSSSGTAVQTTVSKTNAQLKSSAVQLNIDENQNKAQSYTSKQVQPSINHPYQLKTAPAIGQKRENKTGLPNNLKSGVENLSGFTLDDVKVHYNSAKPAQLQAHAFAQGTAIHVAPGQEKHLPHEAWHVVQQKQGRVQPTVQMKAGVAINDDKRLENEADIMGEKAISENVTARPTTLNDRFTTIGNTIQGKWPWEKSDDEKKALNKKEADYNSLSPTDLEAARMQDRIAEQEKASGELNERGRITDFRHTDRNYVQDLADHRSSAHESISSPAAEKTSGFIKKLSGGASLVGGTAGTIGMSEIGKSTFSDVGSGLGVIGSLVTAGTGVSDIATSPNKKKDKGITGVGVGSALANATQTGASGINTLSKLIPDSSALGSAASVAGTVMLPAAMVKNSSDVVTGLATGGLAHYRSNKLAKMGETGGKQGIKKFAENSQWTKAKANYLGAAAGAVGVAGGALALAGLVSNPVGWTILAGAGMLGVGIAAYKMVKKHQQGKALKNKNSQLSKNLRNENIAIPDKVPREGIGDYFKTESMRRHDRVRGNIAQNLAEHEGESYFGANESSDIVGHLGVGKKKASEQRSLNSFSDSSESAEQMKRAKAIAKGLDF